MQHKLARDAAKAHERQLKDEVESLQKQYAEAAAQLAASSSARDLGTATHAAELERARQAAVRHEAAASELQSAVKRLEKEKRALQAHLEASVGGGGSAEALANLRRALEAERECETAKMQLEVAQRNAQQVRIHEEIRVKKMEAQLEEASRKIRAWSVRITHPVKHCPRLCRRVLPPRLEPQLFPGTLFCRFMSTDADTSYASCGAVVCISCGAVLWQYVILMFASLVGCNGTHDLQIICKTQPMEFSVGFDCGQQA